MIGGTSMGAVMASLVAMGLDWKPGDRIVGFQDAHDVRVF